MMTKKWDKRFMELAKQVSTWSKDKSTGVGAVIVNDKKKVLSLGFNGFPRGVDDDVESRHERPEN
jgi:dCMP deaminase